tara:strand:- start:16584 stop:20630 length:4047 start_codon:yes stop_codon:yes gene_type:complete
MTNLADQMEKLRSEGNYAQALERFLNYEGANPSSIDRAFRSHFLGMRTKQGDRPCLVIAGAARGQGAEILKHWGNKSYLWGHFQTDCLQEMAQARRKLIEAVNSERQKSEEITKLIQDAVDLYDEACPQNDTLELDRVVHNIEPGFLKQMKLPWEKRLRAVASKLTNKRQAQKEPEESTANQSALPIDKREQEEVTDWDHPALLLAGETLAYLLNKGKLPKPKHSVETWVLVQLSASTGCKQTNPHFEVPEGLLARLVVEKVPDGSGLLYPDCRYSGYLALDSSFQQGLRNVMLTLRKRTDWKERDGSGYDYRWRLIPLSSEDGFELPLLLNFIEGRSAEAAFACAVNAAARNERLDPQKVISASFAEPGAAHERLEHVEGVTDKLLALRQEVRETQSEDIDLGGVKGHFINQILLYGDQNAKPSQVDVNQTTIKLMPVTTFEQAYQSLSEYCGLTDLVKRHLKKRAKELLKETCSRYVRSSLSAPRPGDPSKKEPQTVFDPLPKAEVKQILTGNLGKNKRICILAESGLGKSTMLIDAEYQIASQKGGNRMPLRLGAGPASCSRDGLGRWNRLPLLSDFDWSLKKEKLLHDLGEQLLGEIIPEEEKRDSWLETAVDRGDVVFLLDALDQTDEDLKLGHFLKADGVRDCPVILSGRPETERRKAHIYIETTWRTLWVDPFDESRIKNFWEEAPFLDQLLRTEEWEALRNVPILLQQMKRLALSGELADLKNREDVYHKTLKMLIQHGQNGMYDAGQKKAAQIDLITFERFLGKVAWKTIALGAKSDPASVGEVKFTGVLNDEAYADFAEEFLDRLDELDQLNLTTHAYVDRSGIRHTQLAWRHFSFCEWFAGLHLAGMSDAQQEDIFRTHARDERWKWIIRFAVCSASRKGNQALVDQMATCLLKFGAAFLLWEIIGKDDVKLDESLELLCRWLVHRNWDGRKAWAERPNQHTQHPVLDSRSVSILQSLFACDKTYLPLYRDSRWLHPAWELVVKNLPEKETVEKSEVEKICEQIHAQFLSEFEHRVIVAAERNRGKPPGEWQRPDRGLLQLVPEDCFVEDPVLKQYEILTPEELKGIRTWPDQTQGDYRQRRNTFNQGLKDRKVNYCLCPPEGWEHPYGRQPDEYLDIESDPPTIHQLPEDYAMQRTPMTNLQFEAFDPSHIRLRQWQWRRENESDECQLDDHPVVYVSCFEAEMMAVWLTGILRWGAFRLPEDLAWSACCQAGRDRPNDEFGIPRTDAGGQEYFDSLSSQEANFKGRYPFGRAPEGPDREGTITVDQFPANGFGLIDMHGQVWEWMQLGTQRVDSRSVRGGSWYIYAGSEARASDRNRGEAWGRSNKVGFRLSRTK